MNRCGSNGGFAQVGARVRPLEWQHELPTTAAGTVVD